MHGNFISRWIWTIPPALAGRVDGLVPGRSGPPRWQPCFRTGCIFLVAVCSLGLWLISTSAQANDLAETFNPLPGQSQTRVIVYGNTVGSPYGTDSYKLNSKRYAVLLVQYLNAIGRAIKNCDKKAYDHNVMNIKALVEIAQKDYEAKEKAFEQARQKEREDRPWLFAGFLSKEPASVGQAFDDHWNLAEAARLIPPFVCPPKTAAAPPPPPPPPPPPVIRYMIGEPPGRYKRQDEERREIGFRNRAGGGPRTELASWTGGFGGVQANGSFSSVTTSEFFAATGERTNRFDDTGSGFGGGVNFGYNWQPWGNNVVVGVVFDINGLNDSVRHDFTGGNYIGSVVNFTGSALVSGGVLVTPNVLLFGQGGISIAKQQLKIDFGGPETNESQWTPGFTLGFGGEWKLPAPVLPISKGTSVFVDYKRTWWNTANLTMPVASPLFNYGWRRNTDGIDIGLRFRL